MTNINITSETEFANIALSDLEDSGLDLSIKNVKPKVTMPKSILVTCPYTLFAHWLFFAPLRILIKEYLVPMICMLDNIAQPWFPY
jgi:hypothetical protein